MQSYRVLLSPLTYILVGNNEVGLRKAFGDGFQCSLFCVIDFAKGTTISYKQCLA
jgi:hypothetical protein